MRISLSAFAWALLLHLTLGAVLVYCAYTGSFSNRSEKQAVAVSQAYFIKAWIQRSPVEAPVIAHSVPVPLSPVASMPASAPASTMPVPPVTSNAETLKSSEVNQLLILVANSIQSHLQYPRGADTAIEQGDSLIQFELTPTGQFQNIQLLHSSGAASLDQAAILAVQASSPIAIPENLFFVQNLTLQLPVHFKINQWSLLQNYFQNSNPK